MPIYASTHPTRLNAESPWLDAAEQVPLGHIFRAAEKLQISVAEVSVRLQQLGFATPVIDLDKIGELTEQDIVLLSKELNAELPWLDAAERVPLAHIFFAAGKLQMPVADINARLQELGFTTPAVDLDKSSEITWQDNLLLPIYLNVRALGWLGVHVAEELEKAANLLEKSVDEIAKRLEDFDDKVPKISACKEFSKGELFLLRHIFPKKLEKSPEASKIINKPSSQFIQLAQVLFDLSVEDAEQYLRDLLERIFPDESAGVNKALAGG